MLKLNTNVVCPVCRERQAGHSRLYESDEKHVITHGVEIIAPTYVELLRQMQAVCPVTVSPIRSTMNRIFILELTETLESFVANTKSEPVEHKHANRLLELHKKLLQDAGEKYPE